MLIIKVKMVSCLLKLNKRVLKQVRYISHETKLQEVRNTRMFVNHAFSAACVVNYFLGKY